MRAGDVGARFDFEHLAAICRTRYRPLSAHNSNFSDVEIVASVCGKKRQSVDAWRRRGLGVVAADRAAVSLGLHPGEIWPEWFNI